MEIQRKLKWEVFEPLMGSWATKIKPFFDSGGFEKIYEHLKKESFRGIQIAPKSENVFRAFKETPFDDLKIIIMGLAPYHTFYNNEPIADGLCMSCGITKKLQPSLEKWYDSCERELGIKGIREPDLSFLAKQGCLLLNAGLTVSKGKPGNHNELWEPFIKFLFEEVINTNGIPVVLLGKEAQKMKRYIMPFTWVFEVSHPASASYNKTDWDSENIFQNVNKVLKDNNKNEIQWIKKID